ncbi:MAG: sulfotransferase family protein [Gammaproteobacteria bacterium]|nr:sulfotransferase family protein [Gammaproteobacteria bacterium]
MYPADKGGSRWLPWYNAYWTFAVVRDPTSRLLSAYQNRIIDRGRISDPKSKKRLSRAGLSAEPTLEEFIENLPMYREHSRQIRKHTEPQSNHLRDVFSRTKNVFPIEKVSELMRILNEHCGTSAVLPHAQKSKKSLSKSDLNASHKAAIRDYYAEDYEMLSEFYAP